MILPVIAYGDPVLREETLYVEKDHEGLALLVNNMFETMYNAKGVGLAAPQVGELLKLFIVDTKQLLDNDEEIKEEGIKKVFINPEIIQEEGSPWKYEEGCLSIPFIREDVERLPNITIRYQNLDFEEMEENYDGITARVIQHEYDHIQGILFVDYLKPLKRGF